MGDDAHSDSEIASEIASQLGEEDVRVEWLETRVISSLKSKSAAWARLLQNEDYSKRIAAFLNGPHSRTLVFWLAKADELTVSESFPPGLKKKCVYFHKREDARRTLKVDDLATDLAYGDLGSSPLEHMYALLEEVFLPLLRNQKNHSRWPQVVVQDVMRHFNKFVGDLFVTLGRTKGETRLPLPPTTAETAIDSGDEQADKDTIHSLESHIIEWTYQIKNVVRGDPEAALNAGLNPGPLVELDFWAQKAASLQSVYDQLQDPKVQKVIEILRKSRSSYYASFDRMHTELVQGLEEATSNNNFLRPLRPYFETLTNQALTEQEENFRPMVHVCSLIWQNSAHYNTTGRMVVLMREICNALIDGATEYLDGSRLLKNLDEQENVDHLTDALKVISTFKQTYFEYKKNIESKDPSHAWNMSVEVIFDRLEPFLQRCSDICDLSTTCLLFNRLENVQIGGSTGKILSNRIQTVHSEYITAMEAFKAELDDILDLTEPNFGRCYTDFLLVIADLERRIGAILVQGFDDCVDVHAALKLLDTFDGLLQRDNIHSIISPCYVTLINLFAEDLDEVHSVFRKSKDDPPLYDNMAPVSGTLRWTKGLRDRISFPMERIEKLCASLADTEDYRSVVEKYEQLLQNFSDFDDQVYKDWEENLDQNSQAKLELPILARDEETHLIKVNFDPHLVALLKEVKYFDLVDLETPEAALEVAKQGDTLEGYIASLDLTRRKYNNIWTTLLDVERPLVQARLTKIDSVLQEGMEKLTWKDGEVPEYLPRVLDLVMNLDKRVAKVKHNQNEIRKMANKWWSSPLLERTKEKKAFSPEEDQHKIRSKYDDIMVSGQQMHKLLSNSKSQLEVPEGDQELWEDYVDHVNKIVSRGFVDTIHTALKYLIDQMDPNTPCDASHPSLMEASLLLQKPDLIFTPSMEKDAIKTIDGPFGSVEGIINDWIKCFYEACTLVKRLDEPDCDYLDEVIQNGELNRLKHTVLSLMRSTTEKARAYRDTTFGPYSFLWLDDRDAYLERFLVYGPPREVEQDLPSDDEDFDYEEAQPEPPTLDDYDAQIVRFLDLRREVSKIPNVTVFDTWLRVDSKPVKQSISQFVDRWVNMFVSHLLQDIIDQLSEVNEFMEKVTAGLTEEVQPGDVPGLITALTHLHAVQVREEAINGMFAPLQRQVELLHKYDRAVPDHVMTELERTPADWNHCKKLAVNAKEVLNPMQTAQVAAMKKEEEHFQDKVERFRTAFLERAPFNFDVGPSQAYDLLNMLHREVEALNEEAQDLKRRQELFDLAVQAYKSIDKSRQELKLLKSLWDMIAAILSQLNEWKETPWEEVDTEDMELACRNFAKDIKGLDKRIRIYNGYVGLESYVKNFLTTLPLVQELRSPAMRSRHWKQLMTLTGVKFTITQDFKLSDLLDLNLHNFSDDVDTIVDRASKEEKMEKQLAELESTWASMEFEYTIHPTTESPLLAASDAITEVLEDNQVMLGGMQASKYVAHFVDEVNKWFHLLGSIEQVLGLWLDVQRTWLHLESIFIGSEDIRAQLPEDSKRFDSLDADYKDLMRNMVSTPNVIDATQQKGVYETLERLRENLDMCQKSLEEYLETKRRAFPRFYFVSPNDLLDILSKGAAPVEIMRHMPKLFDNIAKLELLNDPETGEPGNIAVGMYSQEGEYVEFCEQVLLHGAVETWLNKVVDVMRRSLHAILEEAVREYGDMPREEWLTKYPAQLVLVASQIWWTSEVTYNFDQLEAGNENALKEYNKKQDVQLKKLIEMIQGNLDRNERGKVMNLVTLDVHALDVVAGLVRDKIDNPAAFGWVKQLRLSWEPEHEGEKETCLVRIADAEFTYQYEYLGNAPRLVITPLTDRCYITLTQALRLIMGGAPAGPAGTGKTETTKDLGRGLGLRVYVFNCSEQMDYKSMGDIFKGLAMSGSWGCFDEFNRIPIEVLSVVSTQFKSILDAIKADKDEFLFQEEEIYLKNTMGAFITMNPGYAGRTELPENLKALFRPVVMIVPDLQLICEIMLMAQGFKEARVVAKKFTTLYALCRELLSKQDHYDWGLRAIKSVLVVAGALRRSEPHLKEEQILMRALRDFNLPKIIVEDAPLFLGLINDLFPRMDLDRKRDMNLEENIIAVLKDAQLQAEDVFVRKVVELKELMEVRHSVFIIGPSGAGKSECWKTLAAAHTRMGSKTITQDLNPKAVSSNELYGYIHPATREWKDGLFSIIMRNLSEMPTDTPKWIILDGDIDPEWIESLNTVMDDNKVLTLASNERIPLRPWMRLVFEIANLTYATPATVSRAGILYINESDLGWNPYVQSWIDRRENSTERSNLVVLFDKYTSTTLQYIRENFSSIVPVSDFNMVQTICALLEGLLTSETVPPGSDKELYELYFVFAAVWAFGGALATSGDRNQREAFSKWWRVEWKTVRFPDTGTVFDYRIDEKTRKLVPWTNSVPKFEYDPELPVEDMFVHSTETVRLSFMLDRLVSVKKPVLLVGTAGSGKTMLAMEKLRRLDDSETLFVRVNLNFHTDSATLQSVMEQPLEKKHGTRYGPPGQRNLIFMIDDLNMPEVDIYNTQGPSTLLRQHLDYGHFYDRTKMTRKTVANVQYIACMNPKSGSFTVNPRLQRHFAVFAVNMPGEADLKSTFSSILKAHFDYAQFSAEVKGLALRLTVLTVGLHQEIEKNFIPTSTTFHYQFNLRDMAKVTQGLILGDPSKFENKMSMVNLWVHEAQRVYSDRLATPEDLKTFDNLLKKSLGKFFDEIPTEQIKTDGLIYSHFAGGYGSEKSYERVPDYSTLNKILETGLAEHNEVHATMDLVLFTQAMEHVSRISRILEMPNGNALLIGVGGSGKQSLARLAAFISEMDVFQISITKSYDMTALKTDLQILYQKAGVKNIPTVFLFTDSQIVEPKFLVYINDLLSTGNIPDLFTKEDADNICGSLRSEVKAAGIHDTRDNIWDFFIAKVRRNLHCVLCFSPVGDTFRIYARRFPAILSGTMIDWFHPWPAEALTSVASRFLSRVDIGGPEVVENVVKFVASIHGDVNEVSREYLAVERRHNYTTPKSFLELINFYIGMLSKGRGELKDQISRLENGLLKLEETGAQVADLQESLQEQQVVVEERKEAADALLQVVGKEKALVDAEREVAEVEEEKMNVVAEEVKSFQEQCSEELAKAEPAIIAAEAALDLLDKKSLTELKSFTKPTKEVANVMSAVLYMIAPEGRPARDVSWGAAKKAMGSIDRFINQLRNFDKEHIPAANLVDVRKYVAMPGFNKDNIMSKSRAAAGICEWVRNIVIYYDIYCEVQPKRDRLEEANAQLMQSQQKLASIKNKVESLNNKLRKLQAQFEKATEDKNEVVAMAEKTQLRIELANRLVDGLAGEKVRWREEITRLESLETTLVGDTLLAAAYVSYIGPFTSIYREKLATDRWLPLIKELKVPLTEGVDPVMDVLTNMARVAEWSNNGLPGDRLSVENGAIVTQCERWPLLIDPQLQGVNWLKNQYGEELKIIRLGQPKYLDVLEHAIEFGEPVLIEQIGESIDAVLDPVIGRFFIKRGHKQYVRLGDKEVEYDPKFRLFLQTKLANPHYRPEIQAQTTLVNFTVTEIGLEEQLLALVVKRERPDLEAEREELIRTQNEFKIRLKELEDNLLAKLSAAEGDILADVELIENLETTKKTATEIQEKQIESVETERRLNDAREQYRRVAERGALLYFLLNELNKVDNMYQFSLGAFVNVFDKAISMMDELAKAEEDAREADDMSDDGLNLSMPQGETVTTRVNKLIDTVTYAVYKYGSRGLFVRHKMIFSTVLCLRILMKVPDALSADEIDHLLRPREVPSVESAVEWLDARTWGQVLALREIPTYANLATDIIGSSKRWKEWANSEQPEISKMPQDWKNLPAFQRLLIIRALRPDRLISATRAFISTNLSEKFVEPIPFDIDELYMEMTPYTPLFFILSPGVDPVKQVELLGERHGFTAEDGKFKNVALGQGQEIVAELGLENAARTGSWIMLQNINLTAAWLPKLEKQLESLGDNVHEDFRVFLSAEPSATGQQIIPIGILQNSIKVTNEPPQGFKANMHRALGNFTDATWENSNKQNEFKSILFGLCFFHALVLERRKFGPQGWNIPYNFNTGDLTISVDVLNNYLETSNKIPWEDMRYIFGEIMYGGHISDDWDRRLCSTYLERLMKNEILEDLELAPGFRIPPSGNHASYHKYIDEYLPPDTPHLFGMHPNAEIDFMTSQATELFKTILDLQPRSGGDEDGRTLEDKVSSQVSDILDSLPDLFDMAELYGAVDDQDRTPFIAVLFQECARMNILLSTMRRSLEELTLGLAGTLTMSDRMETLMDSLFLGKVPTSWAAVAYPSLRGLGPWVTDLHKRVEQLQRWSGDLQLPKSIWLPGLFNPQSFLRAAEQTTARKNAWPLDKMILQTEILKKPLEEIDAAPREGAYIHGLYLEGAKWDSSAGQLADSSLKDLHPHLPVMYIKAVTADKRETKDIYNCPVYGTKRRGPTYIFTATLRTKQPESKWILSGLCLLLEV
eukprot:TRINITY_DN730_c1_g2_i2.p1 TRINITY_DN730_c1_g2~~TRINITY_DN730_c1_g2_i2.p1  ORF type:complete len:4514 (+),score=1634.66 TRINITY_DN730_c1_g2_i2:234-13775(+)